MRINLLTLAVCCGVGNAFVPTLQTSVTTLRLPASTMETQDVAKTEYMPDSLFPPLYNRPAIASHRLSRMEIQKAIVDVKKFVENRLESDLNVIKVRRR